MNCILGNILSTDIIFYHGTFQFIDDQAALKLNFEVNPIPLTMFSSYEAAK